MQQIKTPELIGYARVQIKDDIEPKSAKIMSDGSCHLDDGQILMLPKEEISRFERQMAYKKRDDRLTNQAVNIMSPPSLDEKPYRDEEDIIREKKKAEAQKQAAIVQKRKRQEQLEQERLMKEKKKNRNRVLILLVVLAIAACGFFISMRNSGHDLAENNTSVVQNSDGSSTIESGTPVEPGV